MVTGAVAAAAAAHAANIEGWLQIGELALALVLSAAIGLEREIRQKNAGLRTHTLVGVGAALFMLISKYGFTDILQQRLVLLDPSRVAAQIVSGIGFIGAGLIFVRRDSVRGLTTAASIWLTAAVGAAAGAGLPLLAVLATAIYLVVALAFSAVTRRLPLSATAISALHVRYPDGHGILRRVLQQATELGFAIDEVSTETVRRRPPAPALAARGPRDTLPDIRPAYVPDTGPAALETLPADPPDGSRDGQPTVEVTLHVHGRRSVSELAAALSEIDHVEAVLASDANAIDE